MRRRPSQITLIDPVPSYSSASSAGTPPRGRSVTVLSVPCTTTLSRSRARRRWASRPALRGVLAELARLVAVLVGPAADRGAAGGSCAPPWGKGSRSGVIGGDAGSVDPTRLGRQPQRQRAPRRHRLAAPSYDDLADGLLPAGRPARPRRRAGRSASPAAASRTLVADDPAGLGGRLARRASARAPCRPARRRSGPPARSRCRPCRVDLGGDLRPQLVPRPTAARGRERPQLQRALLADQHGRDHLAGGLVDLELHLHPLARGDQQAAEVDALVLLEVDLGLVERPGRRRQVRRSAAPASSAPRGWSSSRVLAPSRLRPNLTMRAPPTLALAGLGTRPVEP